MDTLEKPVLSTRWDKGRSSLVKWISYVDKSVFKVLNEIMQQQCALSAHEQFVTDWAIFSCLPFHLVYTHTRSPFLCNSSDNLHILVNSSAISNPSAKAFKWMPSGPSDTLFLMCQLVLKLHPFIIWHLSLDAQLVGKNSRVNTYPFFSFNLTMFFFT